MTPSEMARRGARRAASLVYARAPSNLWLRRILPSVEKRLVLASGSPRRAGILKGLNVAFDVIISNVDETLLPEESGEASALRLARAKARAVAARTELPVLAADTVVLCDEAVLGKPASDADARDMLGRLSGRTHVVATGVCLLDVDRREAAAVERTQVTFAVLTAGEIDWYVSTGEPADKAGAYHVDGRGALFLRAVEGSPSNVAGLPVELLYRLTRELGLNLGWPPG
jgi:septum formation protein